MALKDIWTNKVNDQDFVDADDVNAIAESVINLENEFPKVKSPTVSVSAIDGGHRVYITDVNGTKIFDVMDGEQGYDGGYYTPEAYQVDEATFALNFIPSKAGMNENLRFLIALPAGAPGKTPVRGVDYWTDADIAVIKGYVDEAILGGAW